MDYARWAETQKNPNPNPNADPFSSLSQTTNYSANLNSGPYQPFHYTSSIDPHNALPQLQPPGVDPPYVPQLVTATVAYTQPSVSFEPQQAPAAAVSYYPDPNVSWAAAISQFRATPYAAVVTVPNPAIQSQRSKSRKKGPKKTKVVQSAWCEVCKIDCNSKGVLDQHKLGKKHNKNLEKLKGPTTIVPGPAIIAPPPTVVATSPAVVAASTPLPISALAQSPVVAAASTPLPVSALAPSPAVVASSTPLPVSALVPSPAVAAASSPLPSSALAPSPAVFAASTPLPVSALVPKDELIIGAEENPDKSKAPNVTKSRKKAAARTEDLETKRRKVLEGGAAADAVRACTICNVVCNSDTVFNYHLAGQKHAAMIKKHTGVASAM